MSNRTKHPVKTTMTEVSVIGAKFAIANATGTFIDGTDQKIAISGSSALGIFQVQLPANNIYNKTLSYVFGLEQSQGATGSYELVEVGHSAVSGTFTGQLLRVSGSAGGLAGGVIVTGQSAAEVAKAQLTGTITIMVRDQKIST